MVDLSVMPLGYIMPDTVEEAHNGWYYVKVKGFGAVYTIQYKPAEGKNLTEVYYGKHHEDYLRLRPGLQKGVDARVNQFFWKYLH